MSNTRNFNIDIVYCVLVGRALIPEVVGLKPSQVKIRQYAGEQTTRWKLLIFCM